MIVNLTDRRADRARSAQLELIREGPDRVLREVVKLRAAPGPEQQLLPHLEMPAHHDVRGEDVLVRRLRGTLAAAADAGSRDFAELLLTPGVGARTVEALAQLAEVVHGAPYRFSDPARFSLALGGKDRHPFPVPLRVYDETLCVLRGAVEKARLGNDERLVVLRRLDEQARLLERMAQGPTVEEHIAAERQKSHALGGMSVFGPEPAPPAETPERVSRVAVKPGG